MPEAVIVATARSPIGRAFKGSLTSIRPDDLLAQIVTAVLAKVPQLEPPGRGPDRRLRAAGRRAGIQHSPGGRGRARPRRRARHHGQPVLLVVAAEHQDGLSRDQGRRGRRVHLRRRRVRLALRKGSSDSLPDTKNPLFAGAQARPGRRRGRDALARPARGRRGARHLHRDGPDRGEPGVAARHHAG